MKFNIPIIILLLLAFGCSKESDQNSTADSDKTIKLETLEVEAFYDEKVTLCGRVLSLNSEKIVEHGFVVESLGTVSPARKEFPVSATAALGKVTLTISPADMDLRSRQSVSYQYYIKTQDNVFFGDKIPIVFSPISFIDQPGLQATIGETISVPGDFGKIDNSYILYVGRDNVLSVPFRVDDGGRTLLFEMPSGFAHGTQLTFNLSKREQDVDTFLAQLATVKVLGKLNPPESYDMYLSDYLRLSGPGVPQGFAPGMSIIIGDQEVSYFYELALWDLLAQAKGREFQLGFSNGRDRIIFPQKVRIPSPGQDDFRFHESRVHPGSNTTGGRIDMLRYGAASASIGGKLAGFTNMWNGVDNISVGMVEDGDYPLVLKGNILNYTSKSTIKVEKLRVSAVFPLKATLGDQVSLSGNFIDGKSYIVYLGGEYISSFRASGGQLTISLPNLTKGDKAITVGYGESWDSAINIQTGLSVEVLPASFDDFYPKSGPPGTNITLKGKGIGSGQIHFGDEWVFPHAYGKDEVTVMVPYSVTKGKKRVSVRYFTGWLASKEPFEVL